MLKLAPGVPGREPPVDGCRSLVSLGFQCGNFAFKGFCIANATIQTLFAEDAELNLCHPFGKLRTGLSQLPCLGV